MALRGPCCISALKVTVMLRTYMYNSMVGYSGLGRGFSCLGKTLGMYRRQQGWPFGVLEGRGEEA